MIEIVVAAFFKRPVTLLHRKHAPRHHDDGRRGEHPALWCGLQTRKVVGKALGVNGGRGDDHFQVRPARQNLAQITQQKINIEAALVGLVNDDGVVRVEQGVGLRLCQQNTIGHELHRGVFA